MIPQLGFMTVSNMSSAPMSETHRVCAIQNVHTMTRPLSSHHLPIPQGQHLENLKNEFRHEFVREMQRSLLQRQTRSYGEIREYIQTEVKQELETGVGYFDLLK